MKNIKSIVDYAQEKKYSDFDSGTKEILKQKVAQKLAERGYFTRLNQAKGVTESKGNFKKTIKKIAKKHGAKFLDSKSSTYAIVEKIKNVKKFVDDLASEFGDYFDNIEVDYAFDNEGRLAFIDENDL